MYLLHNELHFLKEMRQLRDDHRGRHEQGKTSGNYIDSYIACGFIAVHGRITLPVHETVLYAGHTRAVVRCIEHFKEALGVPDPGNSIYHQMKVRS